MRRKILFAVLIIAVLLTIGMQSALAGDEAYTTVRVRITIGTPAEYSFYADGNYSVAGTEICLERQLYTVRMEGGGVGLYRGTERLWGGASVRIVQHTPTDGRNNLIWMKRADRDRSYRYPGDMEFLIDGEHSCIMAVNHVYIEDYIFGVVPYEMYESWPREALKAGAVAARDYVERRMGSSRPYDVVDTTANQVYYGNDATKTNSAAAVAETANMVLKCGGNLVDVYYSASNGGFTEIPQHIWSATNPIMPYHIVQQDTFDTQNPGSSQEVLIFPNVITETDRIAYQYSDKGSMAPGTGSESVNAENYMKDVALPVVASLGYDGSGRDRIQITGFASIVPNTYIGNHGIADFTGGDACQFFKYAAVTMNIMATNLATGAVEPIQVSFTIDLTEFSNEESQYYAFRRGLRLTTVENAGTGWRIYHRRNGHGIGLSQRGAEQRALSGQTYADILAFYFPNTALETQGYSRPALTPITPPDHTNATVTSDANVRTGPGTSNPEIGTLPQGARLFVVQTEQAPGWHLVLYGGGYAFISASLIQMDSPLPPAEQVTVSFEANGGTPVAPWSGIYGGCIPDLPVTSRDNFTFAGWFYDAGLSNQAAFPYMAARSATLYAKWIEDNCTVTFDGAGGSDTVPVTVANGYAIGAPAAPARYGFDFTGWYTDGGAAVSFPYAVTGSQTLHAGWSAQPQTHYLKVVGLSAGRMNRGFSSTVYSYKITLGENEGSLTLTPYKQFDGAAMTINKKAVPSYTVNLANGKSAKISVKVTFGRKSKTYTFTVTRARTSNNYLGSMSVSAGALSQPFDPNVANYTLSLDENTKSVTIRSAAAAGRAARVSPASTRVSLNNGQSKTVKITVRAQSGARRTYTIRVTRAASTNADLKTLKAPGLAPRFNPGVTNYTVTLPPNKGSIALSAGAAGYKAKVTIDGAMRSSKKVTLANGQTITVRVTVVSQAGSTKEYVITVTRQ